MPEQKQPGRKPSQPRRRSSTSSRTAVSRRSNSSRRAGGSKMSGRSRKVTARSRSRGQSKAPRARTSRSSSSMTTNHEEIRRWAEERGGVPAMVADTGSEQEPGILRIDFPGGAEDSLQSISWDEVSRKFDEQ